MEAPAGPHAKAFDATTATLLLVTTGVRKNAHAVATVGYRSPLKRHPFSGLVDSAGELLHTP